MIVISLLAQTLFLGENLLPMLTLAFGGALVVGNVMAWLRPPEEQQETGERPPLVRTIVFIAIGAVMVVWALASLFSG